MDIDPSYALPAFTPNHPSALDPKYRAQVHARICEEIVDGNYKVLASPPKIVSALAVVPKPNGDIRLIHDLSRPSHRSLNDYASKDFCKYVTVEEALRTCTPGSYLATLDLQWAYRSISIRECEQVLTGLAWKLDGTGIQDVFLADCKLPFGARKSPAIFSRITQSIQRMMHRKGFNVSCYLDDFLLHAPTRERCSQALRELVTLLRSLGLRINWQKVCDPCQQQTYLGLHIDTVKGTLRLDPHKALDLKLYLQDILGRNRMSKAQLRSLGGRLNWAANVHVWGRAFMSSVFKAIGQLKMPNHKMRLNDELITDISWWISHLNQDLNVRQLWPRRPCIDLLTDSSNVGGGAFCQGDWLYVNWLLDRPYLASHHINIKELAMAVEATARWAPLLQGYQLNIFTDNMMTCHILNSRRAYNTQAVKLVQQLAALATQFNVAIRGYYVPGIENEITDSISRLNARGQAQRLSALLAAFNSCFTLYYVPFHMSFKSYQFLVPQFQGMWRSWHNWTRKFRNSVRMPWPRAPKRPTPPIFSST